MLNLSLHSATHFATGTVIHELARLFPAMYFSLVFTIFVSLVSAREVNGTENCVGINAVNPRCKSTEKLYYRDFFYIGGHYQYESSLNSNIYVDGFYVEKLTPPQGVTRPHPIILLSAGVPSGAVSIQSWLWNTASGTYSSGLVEYA